jgi:hypothetical protein
LIAFIRDSHRPESSTWHSKFLEMLPAIRHQARFAFRKLSAEARDEAVAEVIATCLVAFVRLVQLQKDALAYPTVLARYAIGNVQAGRKIASRSNVRDVSSHYAQRRNHFGLERIDRFDAEEGIWQEMLVEDKRATPAEIAAVRIDFGCWLRRLESRLRRIANCLASGETTSATAEKFGLSPARVSQIRRQLHEDWLEFQGESLAGEPNVTISAA